MAGITTSVKQFGGRKVIIADSVTAATDMNKGIVICTETLNDFGSTECALRLAMLFLVDFEANPK